MKARAESIEDIRRFNRHYVPMMALLDQKYLDTNYSAMEVNVLIEIGEQEGCSAKDIIALLRLDKGYLSRLVRRFEEEGLVERIPSKDDGRLRQLYLTEGGRDVVSDLVEKGVRLADSVLSEATDEQCEEVAMCMERIIRIIEGGTSEKDATA